MIYRSSGNAHELTRTSSNSTNHARFKSIDGLNEFINESIDQENLIPNISKVVVGERELDQAQGESGLGGIILDRNKIIHFSYLSLSCALLSLNILPPSKK